ncbi:hypothetical protein BCR34DRAFT_28544 [Clohesyomyces aquaticus]|uniref:Uncharacterized protein n=1 Tax=Clohesyomyces aquaticus TaxID=1231657 RepID=A0A1Y1ZAE8_9PLEO|nr:hypothetical protein BCR34DRAFT_28544 [Clohesyomyces aquaticus]
MSKMHPAEPLDLLTQPVCSAANVQPLVTLSSPGPPSALHSISSALPQGDELTLHTNLEETDFFAPIEDWNEARFDSLFDSSTLDSSFSQPMAPPSFESPSGRMFPDIESPSSTPAPLPVFHDNIPGTPELVLQSEVPTPAFDKLLPNATPPDLFVAIENGAKSEEVNRIRSLQLRDNSLGLEETQVNSCEIDSSGLTFRDVLRYGI